MQGEQLLALFERKGDISLNVLHSQNGHAGSDFSQNGHLGRGGAPFNADGPVKAGFPVDVSQAFQGFQVGVDCGGGPQPCGGADLPHGGRHALAGLFSQEIIHFLLAFCKVFHTHASLFCKI